MAHGCRILRPGPLELWRGGARVQLPAAKATTRIAFLALQEEAVPRGRLAALLWDAPEATARQRLRQELYRFQRRPLGSFLQSYRKAVRLMASRATRPASAPRSSAASGSRCYAFCEVLSWTALH